MELLSVYVTVGAIGFVKCQLDFDPSTPFRSLNLNQIHAGEWNPRNHGKKSETELGENFNVEKKPETDGEGRSYEKRKDFSHLFYRLTNVYDECKSKVNKRLQNLTRAKVKSRLSELKTYALSVYQCVKVLGFRSLDEILQGDFIRITDYAYFVKDGANVTEKLPPGRTAAVPRGASIKEYAAYVLGQEWTSLFCDWFENLLRTHSIKFQLDKSLISQGRARRRDHRMFAMMVMGFMIMASILIPMGFQFLTVLGGKSLLLAKMALIMSAINGLKKIATSNVGYGFYHTGSDGHHHEHLHHGFHEKHYHAGSPNYNNLQGYN